MRIVDFGYADFSTEEVLYPIWTEKDVINGPGEYVCIFNFNGHNYLVTKENVKGKLMVNEIACDFRPTINQLVFYYPKKKTSECTNFEKIFNISLLKDKILSGNLKINDIIAVLEQLKLGTVTISPIDKLFVSMFRKKDNNGNECIEVFGLSKGLFDELKNVNDQNVSAYQTAKQGKRNKKRG